MKYQGKIYAALFLQKYHARCFRTVSLPAYSLLLNLDKHHI